LPIIWHANASFANLTHFLANIGQLMRNQKVNQNFSYPNIWWGNMDYNQTCPLVLPLLVDHSHLAKWRVFTMLQMIELNVRFRQLSWK
jgi:hypothetical protein